VVSALTILPSTVIRAIYMLLYFMLSRLYPVPRRRSISTVVEPVRSAAAQRRYTISFALAFRTLRLYLGKFRSGICATPFFIQRTTTASAPALSLARYGQRRTRGSETGCEPCATTVVVHERKFQAFLAAKPA